MKDLTKKKTWKYSEKIFRLARELSKFLNVLVNVKFWGSKQDI